MITLNKLDWDVYNYLNASFRSDPKRWVSKQELLDSIETLSKSKGATSHDICSSLNLIRIKLNQAANEGQLSHLVLLAKGNFKIAADMQEATEHLKKDYEIGIKRLVRYYKNIQVLKRNGQGKLIDCKGNVITEESLAKRFNDVFNV